MQDAANLLIQEASTASDFAKKMLQALALCEGHQCGHDYSQRHDTPAMFDAGAEPMDFDIFPNSSSSG